MKKEKERKRRKKERERKGKEHKKGKMNSEKARCNLTMFKGEHTTVKSRKRAKCAIDSLLRFQ